MKNTTVVPFVDLRIQYKAIKKELDPLLKDIFATGQFVKGAYLEKFEQEFASFIGTKYAIGLASGTDALHLSLLALGIQKGDEVIVPANTFAASAYAVIYTGAKPVFVDCHPKTYNLDVSLIEKVITKKTKAIMPVHLFGQPAEMDAIKKIAHKYKLSVIEDACQSHGALFKKKRTGSLGDISAFSFYPGKNLGAYGDAGAVTTNSGKLADHVKKLREYGGITKYMYDEIGFNSRMDALQAAVVLTKLKYLEKWNEKRNMLAKYYDKRFREDLPFIKTPRILGNNSVYHLYVIQTQKRNDLMSYLSDEGIQTGIHYPIPLHLQKSLHFLGYKKGDFPVTEQLSSLGLSLPMFPELTTEQQNYVVETIKKFFVKQV